MDPSQLPAFLQQAAQLLATKSVGYGLWAYRAYRRNELHNGHFQQRLEGWEVQGTGAWPMVTDAENMAMYLHASNGPVMLQQTVTLPEGKCDYGAAGASRLCFKGMAVGVDSMLTVVSGTGCLLWCSGDGQCCVMWRSVSACW